MLDDERKQEMPPRIDDSSIRIGVREYNNTGSPGAQKYTIHRNLNAYADSELPEIERDALRLAVEEMLLPGKDGMTGKGTLLKLITNSTDEAVKAIFLDILRNKFGDNPAPANDILVRSINQVFLDVRGYIEIASLGKSFRALEEKGVVVPAPLENALTTEATRKHAEVIPYNRHNENKIYRDVELSGTEALVTLDFYADGKWQELQGKYPRATPSALGLIRVVDSTTEESTVEGDAKERIGFDILSINARLKFGGDAHNRLAVKNADAYKQAFVTGIADYRTKGVEISFKQNSFIATMNVYDATYYTSGDYAGYRAYANRANVAYTLAVEAIEEEIKKYTAGSADYEYYAGLLTQLKKLGKKTEDGELIRNSSNEYELATPPILYYVALDEEVNIVDTVEGDGRKTILKNQNANDNTPVMTYTEMLERLGYELPNRQTTREQWAALYKELDIETYTKSDGAVIQTRKQTEEIIKNADLSTEEGYNALRTNFWRSFQQVVRNGIVEVNTGYEVTVGTVQPEVAYLADNGKAYYFEKEIFNPRARQIVETLRKEPRTP
ncbi:MAG: hypothetical protein LBD99_00565, partial [Candidatus Margulisbacteria bacterium]|nr:hypothetical protein [Candidatus Margulisiibacteriota bacterium]